MPEWNHILLKEMEIFENLTQVFNQDSFVEDDTHISNPHISSYLSGETYRSDFSKWWSRNFPFPHNTYRPKLFRTQHTPFLSFLITNDPKWQHLFARRSLPEGRPQKSLLSLSLPSSSTSNHQATAVISMSGIYLDSVHLSPPPPCDLSRHHHSEHSNSFCLRSQPLLLSNNSINLRVTDPQKTQSDRQVLYICHL